MHSALGGMVVVDDFWAESTIIEFSLPWEMFGIVHSPSGHRLTSVAVLAGKRTAALFLPHLQIITFSCRTMEMRGNAE